MENEELKKAIKFYCTMLPYANKGANPNDDRRLYKISRIAAENGIHVEPEMLLSFLEENEKLELNEDDLLAFAENRTEEINRASYIIRKSLED